MRFHHWLKLFILGISLSACAPVLQAQTSTEQKPNPIVEKTGTWVDVPYNAPTNVAACQSKLKEWDDWAARNVPKCEECAKENDRLSARNEELKYQRGQLPAWGVCAFGFGAGIYSIVLLTRRIRRMRPFSRPRKKLFTLLCAFAWVTLSVWANASKAQYHPLIALADVVFWSLPILFLVGIFFWWLNRTEDQIT
jgi:hypothetical protein